MHREQMNEAKTNKHKRSEIILRFMPAVIAGTVVLWFVLSLIRGLYTSTITELIELDSVEKINYMTDVFNIKKTNNISSYRVSFKDGCMSIIMEDIKDIQELYFENLAYYDITEEDYSETVKTEDEYNELINSSQDNYIPGRYKSPEGEFDGRWLSSWISPSENYWEMRFRDKKDTYSIFIRKRNNVLYCEVRTGWGELEDLRKLRSMN